MPLLSVSLQDGFFDDLVMIRVNGREVYRREKVSTRLILGYADSFEMEVPSGAVGLEIILPLKNMAEKIHLQVAAAIYVGISVEGGKIHYLISPSPYGYM